MTIELAAVAVSISAVPDATTRWIALDDAKDLFAEAIAEAATAVAVGQRAGERVGYEEGYTDGMTGASDHLATATQALAALTDELTRADRRRPKAIAGRLRAIVDAMTSQPFDGSSEITALAEELDPSTDVAESGS